MKKTTLLLVILLYCSSIHAATGWYQDYILFSINNGSNAYYWIGDNPSFGTQLDGNNFGTISTLRITGCDMKYWGTNADRTGGAYYYKIMDASNSTQIVSATEILWTHNAIGGNDFRGTSSTTIDLLSNLSSGTTYKLHIWAKSWGSSQGDNYLSNGGSDYVATFTTPAYFKSYATGNWSTTSTWYSSNDGTNNWMQSSITPNSSASSVTVQTGHEVTIAANATAPGITVQAGGKLTLNSGYTLTATNLTLQSDATNGTATFVNKNTSGGITLSGTATISQYLPTGRNWYVGIPIANGDNSTTASSLTVGGATSVSYWDEPTGAWVNDYAGSLTKGRGYIAVSGSGSATNNISFSGTFNTGSVPVTVTRTVGATKEGFNLIANPYPSYLNPCDLITASSKMEPTIWYRTKGAAYSFETVNTASGEGTNGVTGYIPPMQAFWVRVKANATDAAQNNSETLTFTNAMRYHANPSGVTTTALKAPKSTQNMLLRLQVSNGINADEAIIYANTNASNAYDAYDSHKMSNNSALIPEIYTTVGSEQLVINGLNEIPLNTEIPVGFSNLQSGTNSFKLRASELRNISSDTKVFLLDKSTNAETELTTASDYTFTSEATNTTSRFSVILKSVGQTTGTANASDKKAIVYTNNGHIVFVANEVPTGDNNSLMIFDATGRKVADRNITSTVTGINNINIPGVYLVRAIVNGQPYSAKINLNH